MSLKEKLVAYGNSDYYPFHMPGHKRNAEDEILPYKIDITEIDGFDDLHHADGVILEAEKKAAELYQAKESFFLVNGSTAGNLAALFAAGSFGGKILMARNSHRSAYHGALLLHAELIYLEPPVLDHGIYGSIDPEDVQKILEEEPEIKAVFLTSPTYEGVVSDIAEIAEIVHQHGAYLIVDEAHGAHFSLAEGFPASAVLLGADLVIQSVHKTLPCMTQTAILHNNAAELSGKLKFYLRVFQTSSPSYVLMSSIEEGLRIAREGGRLFETQLKNIQELTENLQKFEKNLQNKGKTSPLAVTLWDPGEAVFAKDPSKLILLADPHFFTGHELQDILRKKYHLETEMAGADYVIAMTSMMDRSEGFRRLQQAIFEINEDAFLQTASTEIDEEAFPQKPTAEINADVPDLSTEATERKAEIFSGSFVRPLKVKEIFEAFDGKKETIALKESAGAVSAEFVYIYPPGTPILVPGEQITEETIALILSYAGMGLSVQGPEDSTLQTIRVSV